MTPQLVQLAMDGAVAALLVATIWFAIRLNGRLAALRDDSERMERLVAGLQSASAQAEEAVSKLKAATVEAGGSLQATVNKATDLKSDLSFIMSKADAAATRLEVVLQQHRDSVPPASVSAKSAAPTVAAGEPRRRPRADSDGSDDKSQQSRLANLLKHAEAASAESPPPPAGAAPGPAQPTPPQSRAERDLQRALDGRR